MDDFQDILDFLHAYVDKLGEVAPVMIPLLVMFILRHDLSMDYWKAIHQIPKDDAKANDPETKALEKKMKKKAYLIVAPLVAIYAAALYTPYLLEDEMCIRAVYFVMLLPPFTFAVYKWSRLLLSRESFHRGVERSVFGKPAVFYEGLSEGKVTRALLLLGGAAISCGALWPWEGQGYAIGFVFFSTSMLSVGAAVPAAKASIRHGMIYSASHVIFLLWLAYEAYQEGHLFNPSIDGELRTRSEAAADWNWFIITTAFAMSFFQTMSLLHRFDCRHEMGELTSIESASGNVEQLILPNRTAATRIVTAFQKPYFITAFRTLTVVILAMVAISVGFEYELNIFTFGAATLYVASPFVMLSSVVLALFKGELKQLLSYEEDWSFAPQARGGKVQAVELIDDEKRPIALEKEVV